MEILIETGKFIALSIGLTAFVYILGATVGGYFFRRSEKNADRAIKKLFNSDNKRVKSDKNIENDENHAVAEKLSYVYYPKPMRQTKHTIRYYSPYLGVESEIKFIPRKIRGILFDNVKGIVISDDLVLLRQILFNRQFPDDIREIAKQYEGRFPNEAEINLIYAKFDEINRNLYECGEPLLTRDKYLFTCGDKDEDEQMNWCLNFATGQRSYADCDSFVCAVLVE